MLSFDPLINRVQRIALYMFFFFMNFEYWDPIGALQYFTLAKLAGFIYILTLAPQIFYSFRTDSIKRYLRPIWLFILLLTAVNIIFAHSVSSDLFDLSLVSNVIIFWFLINHERKNPLVLEKGMLFFALGAFVFSLLGLAGIGLVNLSGRISIFGDNENAIGIRMCIAIIILVLFVAQNRLGAGRLRYLLLIPVPIMFQLLVETGSRVAFISLAVAFVLGLLLFKTTAPWKKIVLLAVGVTVFVYGWQYVIDSGVLYNRLLTSPEDSLGGRFEIWQQVLPIIRNNPFIGVGQTGYDFLSRGIFGDVVNPHNVILEVLCYTGIIGLIIYSVFLFRIFMSSYRAYMSSGLLLSLLLLIPVCGLILSGQILDRKIGWAIFAYIAGSYVFMTGRDGLRR